MDGRGGSGNVFSQERPGGTAWFLRNQYANQWMRQNSRLRESCVFFENYYCQAVWAM
jgi:hypothetical protein